MNYIVAVDNNWGIGKEGDLLFHIPGDMKYFKETTAGKVVVMGDVTLASLPGGKPLPNRTNIVLSDKPNFEAEGTLICRSLDELFLLLQKYKDEDVFVIGGASIYNLLMEYCKKAYITKINAIKDADKFIHNIDNMPNWELVSSSKKHEHNGVEYVFCVYQNKKVKTYEAALAKGQQERL